jgi:MFS family permease
MSGPTPHGHRKKSPESPNPGQPRIASPKNAPSEKLWSWTFLNFIFINFFIFLGFDTLLPTLTVYLESHGHSKDAIGRIFSFFAISSITMRTLAPWLVQRFRALVMIRLGLFFCALAVMGYYWAHTALSAQAARFFHGLGFGITSTLTLTLASQIIPHGRLGEGMGYLGLGTIVTLASGPFLGIWLMESYGFLALFALVSLCYLLAFLSTFRLPRLEIPRTPPGEKKQRPVFLSKAVIGPSVLMAFNGVSISSGVIYMALYCQELKLPYAGWFFGLSPIGVVVARLFAGRIFDRFGHRAVMPPAIFFMLIAHILQVNLSGFNVLLACSVLWGLSTGTLFPSIQAMAFSRLGPERRTEATSSLFNAFDIGFACGSIGLGAIAQASQTFRAVYWGAAANAVLFLLFYLIAFGSSKPRTQAARTGQPRQGC